MEKITAAILMVLLIAVSIGGTSAIVWVICKCFSIAFTWKLAIGVWLVMWLIGLTVKK